MQNIRIHRYGDLRTLEFWQGYVEPDDLSWIVFVAVDGGPVVFLNRDPETGAVMRGT